MEITERINELIELGNDYKQYDNVYKYNAWRHNVLDFVGNELEEENLRNDIESLFDSNEIDSEQKIFEILDSLKSYYQTRTYLRELICYSSVYVMFGIPFNENGCWLKDSYQFKSLEDIIEYNWHENGRIVAALGYNDYIALVFDNFPVEINDVLATLNLPSDYEWVILEYGSKNFHILLRNEEIIKLYKSYDDIDGYEILYGPKENFSLRDSYQRLNTISVKWSYFVTLPNSNNPNSSHYYFRSHKVPKSKPLKLNIRNIDKLLSEYCTSRQFSSYNLRDSHRNFELTETKKIHISYEYDGRPNIYYDDDTISWLESVHEGEALNSLAIKYIAGKGVEYNFRKAIGYFQKSNTQSSIFNLISLYSVGLFNEDKRTLFNLCRKLNIDAFKSHIEHIESNLGCSLPLSKKCLFIDTETNGLPLDRLAKITDSNSLPRLVQLSWILTDFMGNTISNGDYIIKPNGFLIPNEATRVHGITTEHAVEHGYDLSYVLSLFQDAVNHSDLIIGHNVDFDKNVINAEFLRKGKSNVLQDAPVFCTMKGTIDYCKIPGFRNSFRYPKLQELYLKLFNHNFENAHNSFADVTATKECFFKLLDDGIIDISEMMFH